ncbi:uncharacterized protein PFLUO_LOCUS6359 [Penicillium psychrofluorescens]|uniref:uncharacterized protein n=1 Tax=Penicillium psychrofluorescens TaxID=3158075 RepID=UPI003CCC916F
MSGPHRRYDNSNYDGRDVPPPPSHRYSQSMRDNSTVTPDVDNLGPASVGGGISGIALGVANTHDRLSGVDAVRGMQNNDGFTGPAERGYHSTPSDNPYVPPAAYSSAESLRHDRSYGSNMALGAATSPPGMQTPGQSSTHLGDEGQSHRSSFINHSRYNSGGGGIISDGPYQRQSHYSGYSGANIPLDINPDEIADDGDDDGFFTPARNRGSHGAAAAAGGAAGGAMLGGFFGKGKGATDSGPEYGPVPGGGGLESGDGEKSARRKHMEGRKKRGWLVGILLAVIILGAIIGGAVGGTLGSRDKSGDGSSNDQSAAQDAADNGDLGKDSAEIKALMNNPELHKVFPGIDYTPWGVQYPLCLKYPPSQNNVTRDMAVLTQLTNNVRLYGTDCNQTEMVLHAIDRLELTDMKVWLGVWIDSNHTTINRQLDQLYKILSETKDTSIFKGIIVGNEALYRAGPDIQTAETNLLGYIKQVRTWAGKHNIDLIIGTSDLGNNWNAELVAACDMVMSNIHPFFAGVSAEVAASWTWDFWQTHDVDLSAGEPNKKQIISETGWPSAGGKDCGASPECDPSTPGSVASIDNMNTYMSDWVCQALENGTEYFWFEAFDEPWKVIYNTPGEDWEDKWGLMDAGRNVKPGLKIPDCNGKTVSS